MNDKTPVSAWVLVIPAIIFTTIIWSYAKTSRKSAVNLRALAERLGLEFVPNQGLFKPSARVTGRLRGKPVEVFTYATSAGESSVTWSAVSARLSRKRELTFVLSERSFSTKIGEVFGRHGLATGDAAFDAVWVARSNQPEFFAVALLPELRTKLMAAHAAGARGSFELAKGLVKYAEVGAFTETKRCERFVALADIVCDLADIAEVAAARGGATSGA